MRPIKTPTTNLTYKGLAQGIADLPCRRVQPGWIVSAWTFTDEEREAIHKGANIELGILTEPIPPVSLIVSIEQEVQ